MSTKKQNLGIKRDDQVEVIAGDEKGKRGRVLAVSPARGRVFVEGVNYIWKHLKRSQQHPQGGRLEKEASIHASNVMLVCASCGERTRAKSAARTEKRGDRSVAFRYRLCKKCGGPVSAKDKEYAEKKGA
jgi:large subunit ribosomal protein L24